MPVAYIPRTRELYKSHQPYQWVVNEGVPPWTPLAKPLAECKVALIGSGGLLYRDQPRFHREDTTYRLIPKNATQDELSVWHFGYRVADAVADHNCVFPLRALRQLEAEGAIGEFADPAYSFMGGVYSARKIRGELAPQIVSDLKLAHADALFLVPA